VGEGELAALRAEDGAEATAPAAVALARELVRLAAAGAIPAGEVGALVAEVRGYLVAESRIEELASLADLARAEPPGPVRDALLRALADARLVDVVLAALPPGRATLPPEVERLLPLVPAGAVLDRIREDAGARRAALVAVAAARLPADADVVVARLASLPGDAARPLAQAIAARARAHADAAAAALLAHPEPDVQLAALRAVAAAEGRIAPAAIVRLLGSSHEVVRIAAAAALERHGDAATARAVAAALTERKDYSRAEAEALGRALARLHPGVADRLFDEWLPRRGGILRALRGSGRGELLRWAAVSGLGVLEGSEAERRIEEAAEHADEALRRHCHATLARRRGPGGPRG
jgi:hypothetical protein